MDEEPFVVTDASDSEARRAFLIRCGRFAVITPPAIATLLTVSSVPQAAFASTIGHRPGGGPRPPHRPPPWWWPF